MPPAASLLDPAHPGSGPPLTLPGGARLGPLADADIDPLAAAMANMEPWAGLGYGGAALAAYWRRPDPGAARLGLTCRERLAGALCVRPRWLRGPFLELLCLLPPAQGRGLGRALLGWLAAEAAALGPRLWTSADAANARALAFYHRVGFSEAARLPDLLAQGRDEVLLRLDLAPAPRPIFPSSPTP